MITCIYKSEESWTVVLLGPSASALEKFSFPQNPPSSEYQNVFPSVFLELFSNLSRCRTRILRLAMGARSGGLFSPLLLHAILPKSRQIFV